MTRHGGISSVNDSNLLSVGPPLPFIAENSKLDLRLIRDRRERVYFWCIIAFNVLVFSVLFLSLVVWPREAIQVVFTALFFLFLDWATWKFTYPTLFGHSVRIGPYQYPHLHRLFRAACEKLSVREPIILVINGNGLLTLLFAKRFTRRGVLVLTSNLLDALQDSASSRELMMVIGAQLGHIVAGHYRFWFFTDFVGTLAVGLHSAWKRRCQHTADRIGLILAGDPLAAEQGLLVLTAGKTLASGTNISELTEQREELYDDVWAWVRLLFDSNPYLVDRLLNLRAYATDMFVTHTAPSSRIGAIPLPHGDIRSRAIFIIHGHDRLALLELKNFLFSKFPNVVPLVLAEEALAAATIPEKLEVIAGKAVAAIALLTPDDSTLDRGQTPVVSARSRQNVVLEVGWFWARLGRERCFLLRKGEVELPSDLAGIEYHKFTNSPAECSESIRAFLERALTIDSDGQLHFGKNAKASDLSESFAR